MPWFKLSDGVPMWFQDEGRGPTVLLLPGWTFTTRFYDQQVEDLKQDHRVITLDLRGAGNSGKTPDGHSLSQYATDVRELMDHLELQDVTIVAWAMAVSVTVHLLNADSGRVAGFVWVDHSPRFFTAPDWPYALNGNLTPRDWDRQIDDLRRNRPQATRALLESCFRDGPASETLDWMCAELMKTPTETMAHMLATVANVDLRPMLASINVRVLLINGQHSMVPPGVADWLSPALPQATISRFSGSAHVPYLEEPSKFNREVRVFVAQLRKEQGR